MKNSNMYEIPPLRLSKTIAMKVKDEDVRKAIDNNIALSHVPENGEINNIAIRIMKEIRLSIKI
ncbi:hypothetical protein [Pseudocolwellia agarivorans]|uniref:hypothetical protein n=1 Tax=Pseudocolwellia agarivorans TaxID=1911682 RepID=UPI00111552CB|nr:hypothetical protein [Pseudocolwellia agarivorans]